MQNNKAFTLLEVITAIFILTVGAGASFALIQQSLNAASLVEDGLTQEGVEIVKNIRDQTWLEKRTNPILDWDEYLPEGDWEADYLSQSLTVLYNERPLNIDSNGFYSYSAGDQTKFKRKISISEKTPTDMKVLVEVSWSEKGRAHQIEVLEYITNWYER
jgi:prepilin-type N-terminal cleavage/methylation domain-containing protein